MSYQVEKKSYFFISHFFLPFRTTKIDITSSAVVGKIVEFPASERILHVPFAMLHSVATSWAIKKIWVGIGLLLAGFGTFLYLHISPSGGLDGNRSQNNPSSQNPSQTQRTSTSNSTAANPTHASNSADKSGQNISNTPTQRTQTSKNKVSKSDSKVTDTQTSVVAPINSGNHDYRVYGILLFISAGAAFVAAIRVKCTLGLLNNGKESFLVSPTDKNKLDQFFHEVSNRREGR